MTIYKYHGTMLRGRECDILQYSTDEIAAHHWSTARLLSAPPSMTALRKLEKDPSATTMRSTRNVSLCSAPFLRACTPCARHVMEHLIRSVVVSRRSTPGAALACARRFWTKRPWCNERPSAREGYGMCTVSPASRTA